MQNQICRRLIQLGTAAAIAAILAACSADVTAPNGASRQISQSTARHDDIQGDTTLCRSGWMVEDGRYVCME